MFKKLLLAIITLTLGIEAIGAPSTIFSRPHECRVIASRTEYQTEEQMLAACGAVLGDCVAIATPLPSFCKSNDCECIIVALTYSLPKGLSKEDATKKVKADGVELSNHCESQDAKAIVMARMFETLYAYNNEPHRIIAIRNLVKEKKCSTPLCGAIATYNPDECGN